MIVAITIGAGIFTMPPLIARRIDSLGLILTCWLGIGLIAWIGALMTAELSTRIPSASGQYAFLEAGIGQPAAVFWGLAELMLMSTGSAAGLALVASDYMEVFVDFGPTGKTMIALGVLALLGGLNLISVVAASRFQQLSVVFKAGALLLLIMAAAAWFARGNAPVPAPEGGTGPGMESLGWALMLIFFAYSGWGRVANLGEELADVRRSVPATMIWGLGSIIAIYLLAVVTYHGLLGHEGVVASDFVAADAAAVLAGASVRPWIAAIVIVSVCGSICASLLANSRLTFAMARAGVLPGPLARVNRRTHVPAIAVVSYCCWAAVILLLRQNFEEIITGVVFIRFVFHLMTTVAFFRIRRRDTGAAGAWRMPGYPWLPAIFAIAAIGFIAYRFVYQTDQLVLDLLLMLPVLALTIYHFRRARQIE